MYTPSPKFSFQKPLRATSTVATAPTTATSRGSPWSAVSSGAKITSPMSTSEDPIERSSATRAPAIDRPVARVSARRRFPAGDTARS